MSAHRTPEPRDERTVTVSDVIAAWEVLRPYIDAGPSSVTADDVAIAVDAAGSNDATRVPAEPAGPYRPQDVPAILSELIRLTRSLKPRFLVGLYRAGEITPVAGGRGVPTDPVEIADGSVVMVFDPSSHAGDQIREAESVFLQLAKSEVDAFRRREMWRGNLATMPDADVAARLGMGTKHLKRLVDAADAMEDAFGD